MDENKEKTWELIRSERGPDMFIFQARYDWVRNPRNQKSMRAVILETPDFVNVVAVTPEKKIVVVRQYRFGVERITTEIPSGLMNKDETPEDAVMRELREETGYTSTQWKYLGWVEPNPAYHDNVCHQWLALEAVKTYEPELDEGEEIRVAELSLEELRNEIGQGRMRNALTLLSLAQVFDLRDPNAAGGDSG